MRKRKKSKKGANCIPQSGIGKRNRRKAAKKRGGGGFAAQKEKRMLRRRKRGAKNNCRYAAEKEKKGFTPLHEVENSEKIKIF